MPKVAVILGYGQAVGETILDSFTERGYHVAIVARNKNRLDETSAAYKAKGRTVKGFVGDLAKPKEVPALLQKIAAEFGPIDVAIYNATQGVVPYEAPIDEIESGIAINITSLHVAFNSLLPSWKAAKKGTFLLTGGGFGNNGAWSVGYGYQFAASTKAYFKNFAEAANATFSKEGIHVCTMVVSGAVYGGDQLSVPDPNPEESKKFRHLIGSTYVEQAEAAPANWKDSVNLAGSY